MTRLWETGERIRMEVDEAGMPRRVTWSGQRHAVQDIAKRWRVDLGWWKLHIWREYYKLTTETGLLVIVYCDLLNRTWYLQRLYD